MYPVRIGTEPSSLAPPPISDAARSAHVIRRVQGEQRRQQDENRARGGWNCGGSGTYEQRSTRRQERNGVYHRVDNIEVHRVRSGRQRAHSDGIAGQWRRNPKPTEHCGESDINCVALQLRRYCDRSICNTPHSDGHRLRVSRHRWVKTDVSTGKRRANAGRYRQSVGAISTPASSTANTRSALRRRLLTSIPAISRASAKAPRFILLSVGIGDAPAEDTETERAPANSGLL